MDAAKIPEGNRDGILQDVHPPGTLLHPVCSLTGAYVSVVSHPEGEKMQLFLHGSDP